MLRDNLIMLRNIHGYSQEELAGKIDISRQAYAKWESGATVPDILKCARLAEIYGVSIDSLIREENVEGVGICVPAPRGKHIWGSVTMNERGQIIIPKVARDALGLEGGRRLVVLSDEVGIALLPVETFEAHIKAMMDYACVDRDEP